MLVEFHSSTSGELKMFADIARQVLEILRKEPLARGVITFAELPDAIAHIGDALARTAETASVLDANDDGGSGEPAPVSMRQRLVPFLDLLRRTEEQEGYVMWEAQVDFARAESRGADIRDLIGRAE